MNRAPCRLTRQPGTRRQGVDCAHILFPLESLDSVPSPCRYASTGPTVPTERMVSRSTGNVVYVVGGGTGRVPFLH